MRRLIDSRFTRAAASAALGMIVALALVPAPTIAQTPRAEVEDIVQRYLADHPEALGPAIEKYLTDHPEAVRNALVALLAKRAAPAAGADLKQTIADNAKALYAAPLQTAVGAAEGAITIVEFFDFNCGYCRKALDDTLKLMADEPRLRVVLKEFPVLGPPSVDAARIAIALQMRRPDSSVSLDFHRRLFAVRGRIDRAAALAVAGELGFDTSAVEKDAASAEVDDALQQNIRLAAALGIRGTPGYVVGDAVIAGAIGAAALKERIAALKTP